MEEESEEFDPQLVLKVEVVESEDVYNPGEVYSTEPHSYFCEENAGRDEFLDEEIPAVIKQEKVDSEEEETKDIPSEEDNKDIPPEKDLPAVQNKKAFFCEICNKGFTSNKGLQFHLSRHRNEEFAYKCIFCPLTFTKRSLLESHSKYHTNDFPLRCSYCCKGFVHNSELVEHIRGHTNEKPFHCTPCDKHYSRKKTLVRHIKLFHAEGDTLKFKCELCGRAFNQKYKLEDHKIIHDKSSHFQCERCSMSFRWEKQLKRHEESHSQPFLCDICGQRFNPRAFKKHCEQSCIRKRRQSSDKHKYKCQLCPSTAGSEAGLKMHLEKAHELTIKCEHCNTKFITEDQKKKHEIIRHIRKINVDGKKCIRCKLIFPTMQKYVDHKRQHHATHKCHKCDKYFVNSRGVTRHKCAIKDEEVLE